MTIANPLLLLYSIEPRIVYLGINMRLQRANESNKTTARLEGFTRWILQVEKDKVQGIPILEDGEPN